MITPLHCVFLIVSLVCCRSSQAQCPNLCTTQPLNIKSASPTTNYILYAESVGSEISESSAPYIEVIIQDQQNAEDILWIATFDAGTNSYTFVYESNPSYFLSYQVNELGLTTIPHTSPTTTVTNNLRWVLDAADFQCKRYTMMNLESGTYLHVDWRDNNLVVLAPTAANTDQTWTFPGPSCS